MSGEPKPVIACCGYICSLYGFLVLDKEGCPLPHGHEGPHEFRNSRDGALYQWEYDLMNDEDVYWKKSTSGEAAKDVSK